MNILIIAAHPDDEVLGCGGTLLKHSQNKDNIYWLIVSDGDEKFGWNKRKILERKKEIK